MKNQKETMKKIVGFLNNPDKDGGFWLPNIQRLFVWDTGQIEKLFDSIMREYPIGTLLVWRTDNDIKMRKFIENYKKAQKVVDNFVPSHGKPKLLVLDGQQRLQSLFIGLMGSYDKKELYFDILSGGVNVAPDEVRYKFKFLASKDAKLPWVKFKDIVYSPKKFNQTADGIINQFSSELADEERQLVNDNVAQVIYVFSTEENILYQEVDSIDKPESYDKDDVVEIFIRANSGGTALGKSDLLFSLLAVSWDEAHEQVDALLDELNKTGYGFSRDFVLKTCLTLLKRGAAYNVTQFQDDSVRHEIIEKWPKISEAIMDVKDYLYGHTFIRSHKALSSYLALIPLIYFRFHHNNKWNHTKGMEDYILKTLITGAFSGNPDKMINRCTRTIDRDNGLVIENLFETFQAEGQSLRITKDHVLDQHYGSSGIHLIFNLWYKDFNYHPSFHNNAPQVDHIFPKSVLRSIQIVDPETGKKRLKYYQPERDQIANLALLTCKENMTGAKGDTMPEEWFADKSQEYLDMHLIPKDKSLLKLDNYEFFIEERKKLIEQKFEFFILKI